MNQVYNVRTGLANLDSQEGHTISKDWPEGCTCVYMYRKGGGVKLIGTPLFTNTTFLLFSFIKVSVICSVEILCSVVLMELFRWLRAADTLREGRILAITVLETKKKKVLFFFVQKRLPPCVNNRILYWLCLVCYWSTDSVGGSFAHLTRPLPSVNAVKNRQYSLISTTRPISCQ